MSMSRIAFSLSLLLFLAIAADAHGQEESSQPDRFFADKVSDGDGDEPGEAVLQGSLTSTTFAYRESGGVVVVNNMNNMTVIAENASPVSRLYTDMRAQLDAKRLAGSWDVRLDSRVRLSNSCTLKSDPDEVKEELIGTCRTQSGLYGDNEYDVREFYIQRSGEALDVKVGRQYVLELAATKIDGVKVDYVNSENVTLLGFAGLYPARGSRSIDEDYPTLDLGEDMPGSRVMPIAGGVGASYRYAELYGSIGGVGILPRADEIDPRGGGAISEATRFFVTSNGYWRQSRKLDLYHFAVVDLQGAGGTGLTNLSVGVNFRPSTNLRVNAAVNRVDTETLNVTAQNRLEETNVQSNVIQNNIEVTRIASESFRAGVSGAFKQQRFEVSASGQLRRRPSIQIQAGNLNQSTTFGAAQSGEIMLSVIDRRSYKDFRLGGSVLRILSVGNKETFRRSTSTMVRLHGSKDFSSGKGQYEIDVTYLAGKDDSAVNCMAGNVGLLGCFGNTKVGTLGVGGTTYYRFSSDWFAMGSLSAARQAFTTQEGGLETSQIPNTLLSGFIRVAYRF